MNWTEKYRPDTLSKYEDSLGTYDPIIRWIKSWNRDLTERRFAILHGKPGTGKTTITSVIANDLDYELFITNASDDRNREDIVTAWRVSMTKGMIKGKRLIVLDEADHISNKHVGKGKSAQDHILEMVKRSFNPVILVCNNLYALDKSIRKAKPFTFRFDYPRKNNKTSLANKVKRAEKLDLSQHEIDMIVDVSMTYRSLLYNLQKASMGIFVFDPDVTDEDMFDEFMHILMGRAPEGTSFTPDELMKWIVEFAPNEAVKTMAVNNILGRISGERSTTDMHEYAWKYSNRLLRLCRAEVDFDKRMVNGRKVMLPFESMKIARDIKKEIMSNKPKELKVEKTRKAKSRTKVEKKPEVKKGIGLDQFV